MIMQSARGGLMDYFLGGVSGGSEASRAISPCDGLKLVE